jgi:hypothetical protein
LKKNKNPDADGEDDTFICSGNLKCHNCGCKVVFVGTGFIYIKPYYDFDSNTEKIGYFERFKPTFFEPTVNLFILPVNTPDKVKNELLNSFKLFWCSKEACANSCRKTIELLFDERQIKPNRNLKQRIDDFNEKHSEAGKYLEALRRIGNAGSHNDNIEEADILDAYKLLKFSLEKLYGSKSDNFEEIANRLNDKYKPKK